ncbi:hypothetical protein LWC05_05575 [Acetobacter sicerae]|uniref:DUF4352 domain-containing protein n=1 Tax=Acetobacter sicerae TaxID=85325 RepID=A0ABS8VY12_9PROT|nr:hypothetical protein [Acetobacter sicerae]MCE0743361.1 hypothetical protein [Acetobacter sicerae]
MTKGPIGIALFCDDVRYEIDGRISAIGINPMDEIVFPREGENFMIPVLGIVMRIIIPLDFKFDKFTVNVFREEGDAKFEIFSGTQNYSEFASLKNTGTSELKFWKSTIAQRLSAVQCTPEGKIKVEMTFDDGEVQPMGALIYKFRQEPQGNAIGISGS